jgi:hypothetical protein
MSGPYRAPDAIAEEGAPEAVAVDLGARRSTHARGGVIGGWPEVDVHENGVVLRHSFLEPRDALPFEEIDALHYDYEGLLGGPPEITLVGFDGRRRTLPRDLKELDALLAELDRQVTQPLVALAKEALARGERMVFGPVVVELDGIILNGQNLAWDHLSRVDAERETLVLYAREPLGRFGWARVRELPHPRVLVEVLRQRTTVVARGLPLLA